MILIYNFFNYLQEKLFNFQKNKYKFLIGIEFIVVYFDRQK
jgi:hypothetical protein